MPHFIASCAKGLEYLLKDELVELGASNVKEGLSLVNFECDWATTYKILLWSRIASRVMYPLAKFEALDDDALYRNVSIIDWSQHLAPGATLLVNSQSFKSKLSHTQFVSQRVKDAIVDWFRDEDMERPQVAFESPDLVVHCKIRRNQVTLSIDLAGVGLHQRGYRIQGGAAPIKENLAAALLMRSGWGNSNNHQFLIDPMCGSGTFLIEAAMMRLDYAPGLLRDYLGLFGWRQFNQSLWDSLIEEAENRKQKAMQETSVSIEGSDVNPKAVRNAQMNVSLAGLEEVIKIHIRGLDQFDKVDLPDRGQIIVNPPYSERLGERQEVVQLYHQLGELFKSKFKNWNASILSADKEFGHALGIRADKIYKFNNGSIPCELLNLVVEEQNFVNRVAHDAVDLDFKSKLSAQGIQLCNRLEKNLSKLKKYLNKENITCFRVYDADLPEYNAAIDVYADKIHIQEYRPPKSVDDKLASKRLKEIEKIAAGVFEQPLNHVFIKQRRQQKGDWQYTKTSQAGHPENNKNYFEVLESGRKFLVNLVDYLDTGLFLDHRGTRNMISKLCPGKRFLNLFCYTGSVSVYAATAGAKSVTSVDMSKTYLEWAKRNFKLNKINLNNHFFIREDCTAWLAEAVERNEKYDLIFLDPPTFSNSKKMESHFDIQNDHSALIEQSIKLLNPGGKIFFSNNFQKFEMAVSSCSDFKVQEITKQTTTPDFYRRPLHRCWLVTKL
ncbi:bifunctional 23S rRNA (guanine(2069)-N(7))-methyltransferase RlmK/23S rRNA (guanine(2445)-N(2))-methyltransferase RlmL [Aliikangiella marina]|uniref:Ribosomal RNA large subunit methyltransferase K/L n=1 Tax=Aliikangiella marina TaxID=1712262 RepID=A0A545TEL3_9GAMM|nr:bifunctional 23S rRNA (guanine(2069)-N(7))-methyltransferase RlmK/23S rRNA (guanine(2445)-N(2))-methyltransferase RlmL [Aliikangiella marina]TQV75601.1 bifunctional 23S rRNA (guanine(2069)-N(7))-methyltransferase RlmK/23S rRNA (guanine(2445)-N(2))-methyltransferase RlmL [Aliikangiella marina]